MRLTYLCWIRLLRLFDKSLWSSWNCVVSSTCCGISIHRIGSRAILWRSNEFNSATLNHDVRGWWKIFRVTDRIVITQEAGFLTVERVNLSATAGNKGDDENSFGRFYHVFYNPWQKSDVTRVYKLPLVNVFLCRERAVGR